MSDCSISIHIKVNDLEFTKRLQQCLDGSFEQHVVECSDSDEMRKKIFPYMEDWIPPEKFIDQDSEDLEILISVNNMRSCLVEDIIMDLLLVTQQANNE